MITGVITLLTTPGRSIWPPVPDRAADAGGDGEPLTLQKQPIGPEGAHRSPARSFGGAKRWLKTAPD